MNTPNTSTPQPPTTAHLTSGLHRVLELPAVYWALQTLLGAVNLQRRFVRDFIRPFPGARILDVGCGPGNILDCLPEDVEYVGCDLNDKYIRSAQKKYGARGRFVCTDLADTSDLFLSEKPFDIVVAMAIFHHLDDLTATRLAEKTCTLLKPGGRLVSFDGVYIENQPVIAKHLISRDRGRAVRTPEGYLGLLSKTFPDVTPTIVTDFLRVPYTHFVMNATAGG